VSCLQSLWFDGDWHGDEDGESMRRDEKRGNRRTNTVANNVRRLRIPSSGPPPTQRYRNSGTRPKTEQVLGQSICRVGKDIRRRGKKLPDGRAELALSLHTVDCMNKKGLEPPAGALLARHIIKMYT
jgi:hypothetical protein